MYIFRLAPYGDGVSDPGVGSDVATFDHILDPDSLITTPWVSDTAYQVGEYISRSYYVFVSIKNDNLDDPVRNYVGRPAVWGDALFGYGQNSWLRLRLLSKYNCFVTIQPGYTWSADGEIDFTFVPSKLKYDTSYTSFFGLGLVPSPTYLILYDLVGSEVSITVMDYNSNILSTETVELNTDNPMVPDWFFNPELPGVSRNTIIRPFDNYSGAYKVRVQITSSSEDYVTTKRAGLGGCYIGRATYVGQTQQDKLTFGFVDLSSVSEDEWGQISVNKRRVAKKIDANVFVPTKNADSAFKLIQHVRSTPNFFLFSNNLEAIITQGTVISGLTSIMGLVTNSSQGRDTARSTAMSVTIEAIPTAFNDVMQVESTALCGMPFLPVVPVVDDTPVVPETPAPSSVAVTGVTLSKSTIDILYVGRTSFLYAIVAPSNAGNKTVTWSSSDEDVALVSSTGLVLGRSPGECIITATTSDGGFTATCSIAVRYATAPPPTYYPDVLQFYTALDAGNDTLQFIYPIG